MGDFIINSFSNDAEIYPIVFFTACDRYTQETIRQRALTFYQLFLVLDGNGTLHLNGKDHPLKKGCAVFTAKHYPVGYTDDGGLVSAFITANGSAMEVLSKNFAPDGYVLNNSTDTDKYVSSISKLVSDYQNGRGQGKLSASAYSIFVDFLSHSQSSAPVPMEKTLTYINLHFSEKLSLKELADNAYISVSKLCHDFKKHYGCSVFDYIITVRLQHAYNLLRNYPEILTKDVAAKCGFSDVGYFCHAYRSKYGKTPSKEKVK